MKSQSHISIVLPTYNGSRYLESSIKSCLRQSHQNWELIIVDDASTDNTPEIISQYKNLDHRIKSIRHEQNRKLPGALNTGFSKASGKYLSWTSDDNLYRPSALSEMASFLDTHPDVDFVYSDYSTIDPAGKPIEEIKAESPELLGLRDVIGGCFLYRRSIHEALGGYDEDVFLAEDLDFYLRAMISFNLQPLHKNLYEYREHSMSLTQAKSHGVYTAWEKVLRKHLPNMYWFSKDKLSLTFTRMFKRAFKHKDYLNASKYIIKAMLTSPAFFVKRFLRLSRNRYIKKNKIKLALREPLMQLKFHTPRDSKKQFQQAVQWIKSNTIQNTGIAITNKRKVAYPEVTGYFIPSLLRWGLNKTADSYARWLISIQNSDGSWSGPGALNEDPFTFDTGQILKGLIALTNDHPEYKPAILKGCDWIISHINSEGRISAYSPIENAWLEEERSIPEAFLLYALQPIKEAGEKWDIQQYTEAVDHALNFYLADESIIQFNTLSHFHAYILEALIDLGHKEVAAQGMEDLEKHQRSNGAIPAYPNVNWVCSTGLFQYAVIWYKLDQVDKASRVFDFAKRLQNFSGGFYGSYGLNSTYFYDQEISWAVKYFLDASWWQKHADKKSTTTD